MKPNPLHDQILDLWRQGKSNKEIAAKLHIQHGMVKRIVQEKRKELGPEVVPYARDMANKSTRGKTIRISKTTPINDVNKAEVSITWAGAFKALAYRLHDIGDEEGWKFAQEIAKKKDVRL